MLCAFGFSTSLFAQNVKISMDSDSGKIAEVLIAQNNCLFSLKQTGRLASVYCVDKPQQANKLLTAKKNTWPTNKIYLPFKQHSQAKTNLYITNEFNSDNMQFYRSSYYKKNGLFNALAQVNDIKITYYRNSKHNKLAGIVGQVKTINGIALTYYLDAGTSYRGKLKQVGNVKLKYELDSSYSLKAGYSGDYILIDNLKIKYNEASKFNQNYAGKIKSIGNIKVKYFSTLSFPKAPKTMYGFFDSYTGKDNRFIFNTLQ